MNTNKAVTVKSC